ncbi:hypothetical protein M2338_001515 [Sphingobium sp. B2D3B]|nr:hypothetical protein [Sphingobium sp. B2D3B]
MDGTIDREERHRLIDMITAAWKTKVIGEAVGLGLIEELAAGRHDSAAIAQSLGASEDGVMRLLRALAVLGLVTHEGSDRFSPTPLGDCLRKDAPDSLYGMSGHWNERMWNSFANLGVSVKSGEPSVPSGPDHFVQQQADPARADVFNRAMAEGSLRVGRALARAYDFSDVKTVRDVGGGYGALLVACSKPIPICAAKFLIWPRSATLRSIGRTGSPFEIALPISAAAFSMPFRPARTSFSSNSFCMIGTTSGVGQSCPTAGMRLGTGAS